MKSEFLEIYQKLGRKIAMIRTAKDISQKELGDMLDTDAYYVSKIERAMVGLSMDKYLMLAKALGVEPKELLDFSDIEKYM